jgi:hypothetical protein
VYFLPLDLLPVYRFLNVSLISKHFFDLYTSNSQVLSRDEMVSRSVRIFVGMEDSNGPSLSSSSSSSSSQSLLRIGRPGVAKPRQDLELDGVGIAAESAIVWRAVKTPGSVDDAGVVLCVCAASPEAIVYVNGKKLDYDEDFDLARLTTTPSVLSTLSALKHDVKIGLSSLLNFLQMSQVYALIHHCYCFPFLLICSCFLNSTPCSLSDLVLEPQRDWFEAQRPHCFGPLRLRVSGG